MAFVDDSRPAPCSVYAKEDVKVMDTNENIMISQKRIAVEAIFSPTGCNDESKARC